MKITKELLKKLVREAVEEEMGSEGESGEGYEGTPDDDLTEVPDESPGEPSAGPLSESIKRRFARLANIKHKK